VISRKSALAVSACSLLALALSACGSSDNGGGGSSSLSGTITIDGSSTVYPFAQAAAELFNQDNPDVKVSVGESGTTGGFEKFCNGETDISDASRPIEPEEVSACKKSGIGYTDIQIADDGVSVVTNPSLQISCLTTDQLKQLWDKGSKVTNYSQLGKDADTGQPIPDANVSLYGPGTDSGTFDFFTSEINGVEDQSRDDYQPSEDDNVLVEGVAGDQDGLGYFGFSYYEQNTDKLNLVSVDDGKGCVAPSKQTIQSGKYAPLSRPLFMYPKADALQQPEVRAFMQFVVDNYSQIAEQAQIVPMDSTQAAKAKSDLTKAIG
jgi:phosphate transport system substrate-binding protein